MNSQHKQDYNITIPEGSVDNLKQMESEPSFFVPHNDKIKFIYLLGKVPVA